MRKKKLTKCLSDYDTIEWKVKAILIKIRDKFKCQNCGSRKSLHVHHLCYEKHRRIDNYPSNYLITLCKYCHISEHATVEALSARGLKIKEMLLSGMLAKDIYLKVKNKEELEGKSFRK